MIFLMDEAFEKRKDMKNNSIVFLYSRKIMTLKKSFQSQKIAHSRRDEKIIQKHRI